MITIAFIGHDTCDEDGTNLDHFNNITGIAYNNAEMYGSKFVATIHNRLKVIEAQIMNEQGKLVDRKVACEDYLYPEDEGVFDNEQYERETLLHEFGHMFALNNDHYYGSGQSTADMNSMHHSTSFNEDCIYGENNHENQTEDNFIICEGCRNLILNNADRFNQGENIWNE